MKKNVASQVIGAQMVSASDGSAFTGSVTVAVTGDAGTQATGSVGAGACTHEGNGFHTYAPAQAETNYDHVAFTFTGTGAVPATVQVYTTFPQTGDAYAGQAGLATAANLATVAGYIDTEIAAILQMLGQRTTIASLASQTSFTLTAGSADNDAYNGWGAFVIDQSTATQVALGVVLDYTGSTKTVTLSEDPGVFTMATGDTIILLPAKLSNSVLDEIVEGSTTLKESVRLANAALGGKASGLATTTAIYRDLADSKDRITGTVDEDGNRSAVTLDLT